MDTPRTEIRSLLGIGPLDEHRPVEVARGARERHGDVGIERIVLRAPEGHDVPCLYLTPWDGVPTSAVVAVHQHGDDYVHGKSEVAGLAGDPELAYGADLARAGAATIVPDLLGFEERQRPGADPRRAEQMDAWYRVTRGATLQGQHTVDVALATAWLLGEVSTVREVPVRRAGIVGHSLGGQAALFSLACDPRLAAGVVSCGVGTLAGLERDRIAHNPAWFVPGLQSAGDIQLVARALDGQRVRVLAGRDDALFPVADVEAVARSFAPKVCDLVTFDGGHTFLDPLRGESLAWLLAAVARSQ